MPNLGYEDLSEYAKLPGMHRRTYIRGFDQMGMFPSHWPTVDETAAFVSDQGPHIATHLPRSSTTLGDIYPHIRDKRESPHAHQAQTPADLPQLTKREEEILAKEAEPDQGPPAAMLPHQD